MGRAPRGHGPYGPGAWTPHPPPARAKRAETKRVRPRTLGPHPPTGEVHALGFPGPYGPWPLGSRPIFVWQKHDIFQKSQISFKFVKSNLKYLRGGGEVDRMVLANNLAALV